MRRRPALLGALLAPLLGRRAFAQSALAGIAPPPAANPQQAALDDHVFSPFSRIVLGRWGDAVLPDAPSFTPAAPSTAQADQQFPYDGVIAGLISPPPAEDGIPRLVMVLATPDIPARMVFPSGTDDPAIAGRMQGVTVLNLQYLGGRWLTVDGGYQSRRVSDRDLCQITGPAAAAIGSTVQGILAPSCGTVTPWGQPAPPPAQTNPTPGDQDDTGNQPDIGPAAFFAGHNVLLGEGDAGPWLVRLAGAGPGLGDPANAPRFGWVVEFSPLDPQSIPIKRTALGRLPRAGILATQTPDGRPVVFFTEDAPAGALFRFIAATSATDGTALDSGTIAVAQLDANGIKWAPLGQDVATLAGLAGAARSAGAELFDAPAGLAFSADGRTLYMACAGNAGRIVPDALNPRAHDDNGHIIAFSLPGGDVTAQNFGASLALVAGAPGVDAGTQYPATTDAWLRKPRTLAVDQAGQLWIGTDQNGETARTADGLFILNPGNFAAAYLAPKGGAAGGAAFAPSGNTVFAMVRHPGATPAASFAAPATRWPTLQPNMPPQSTLIGLVAP